MNDEPMGPGFFIFFQQDPVAGVTHRQKDNEQKPLQTFIEYLDDQPITPSQVKRIKRYILKHPELQKEVEHKESDWLALIMILVEL